MAELPVPVEIGIVVLVDPDATTRQAHAVALRAQGFYVEEHANAVSALTRAPIIRPDVIVTEMRLRPMDGAGLCRAIKLDPNTRHTAVIALTSEPEEAAQQEKTVFDRVLAKPIAVERLVAETRYFVSLSSYLRARSDQIIARATDLPEASLALRARQAALRNGVRFCPACSSASVQVIVMAPEAGWWHCHECGEYWRVEIAAS